MKVYGDSETKVREFLQNKLQLEENFKKIERVHCELGRNYSLLLLIIIMTVYMYNGNIRSLGKLGFNS
jgi:uncharacterized protein YqhQ